MKRFTLLLVDDDPNLTASLARSMRDQPFDVLRADSGARALELLDTEPVDVVISDERMPGMSGSEFLAECYQRHPDVIRMMLSGQATLETAVHAVNEGQLQRFFLKPANVADIVYGVRQMLQQRMLEEENEELREKVHQQQRLIDRLERENPGISRIETDEDGAILITTESD